MFYLVCFQLFSTKNKNKKQTPPKPTKQTKTKQKENISEIDQNMLWNKTQNPPPLKNLVVQNTEMASQQENKPKVFINVLKEHASICDIFALLLPTPQPRTISHFGKGCVGFIGHEFESTVFNFLQINFPIFLGEHSGILVQICLHMQARNRLSICFICFWLE